MLSENIRNYRKKMNLSQDELGEKIGVSRQSISFWETGQTQPTIDNIIALAKVFQISSDTLLGISESKDSGQSVPPDTTPVMKKGRKEPLIFLCVLVVILLVAVAFALALWEGSASAGSSGSSESSTTSSADASGSSQSSATSSADDSSQEAPFDLFAYCKRFAIEVGDLHGDYCMYQQPSTKYGGYENEYFSLSYWNDSDMVEFCLHCPLDETLSVNFYLRMRGGYDGKYEYCSSKYYRDTGVSLRSAYGYIDPAVFYDGYPIPCDTYYGSTDGQTSFMEESRVGICDLIRCLKEFVEVEKMDCNFSDFDFAHF